MKLKFFACEHCKNIAAMVKDAGVPIVCCGEKMKELIPGTTEGAAEKHIPVCQVEGNRVTVIVGSTEHPMLDEHSIEWVALQTKQGAQYKVLTPGHSPLRVLQPPRPLEGINRQTGGVKLRFHVPCSMLSASPSAHRWARMARRRAAAFLADSSWVR